MHVEAASAASSRVLIPDLLGKRSLGRSRPPLRAGRRPPGPRRAAPRPGRRAGSHRRPRRSPSRSSAGWPPPRAPSRARTPCRRRHRMRGPHARSTRPTLPACASSWRALLGQRRVGRHDDEGRVRRRARASASASGFRLAAIGVPSSSTIAAEGVHRRDRARRPRRPPRRPSRADPALPARRPGRGLRDGGPRPGARRCPPRRGRRSRPRTRRAPAAASGRATRRRRRGRTAPRRARSGPGRRRCRTRCRAPRATAATPSAAASPNALPPASTIAWTSGVNVPGRRASVSRVPGAPPFTSTDPAVPGGHSTTVHPVAAERRSSARRGCPGRR